jgi:hypothetical protein
MSRKHRRERKLFLRDRVGVEESALKKSILQEGADSRGRAKSVASGSGTERARRPANKSTNAKRALGTLEAV